MKKTSFIAMLILLSAFSFARGTTISIGETVPVDGGTTTTPDGSGEETAPPPEEDSDSGPIPQVTITPADGSGAPSGEGSSWENSEILGVGETSGETGMPASEENAGATGEQPQPGGNGEDRNGASCAPALVLACLASLALFAKK
ncbi:MAG: hypothetical protein PHQ80_02760 [Candidatus ainarchaeum sp.]|nr:hypothetical protein [Candidatus ainarchaeum sp.]MDD5096230.1 hypothetical protein [Candidatus ainarchaeum sp.]